ncbi:hypothetical protein [Halorarius litoreus]|uniref:hypothetical protein n=1 Tax=Halorarius litoreus TaxID=2962676 RepID=UPI0020CC7F25|nr:hypothetical protein [Halorarius litoreus]
MRLRPLAAGTGIALLAPIPAALLGADWLLTLWLLAGGVAGYLAGGSGERGFGYGAGAGLLTLGVTGLLTAVVWGGSLLGLFGPSFVEGAVYFLRAAFMMGWFIALAAPFIGIGVVFVILMMGLAGAVGAVSRSS